jgi:hypothetical protein
VNHHRTSFAATLSVFALFLLSLASSANASTVLVVSAPKGPTYFGTDSQISQINGSDARFGCKIHVANNFVWASAGLLADKHGAFDLERIVTHSLRGNLPFSRAVHELETQMSNEYPDFRSRALQSGIDMLNARIQIVIADVRKPGHVTWLRFGDDLPKRTDCPGAVECAASVGVLFPLGRVEAINPILDNRPAIWTEMGRPKAIRYLITAQEKETPRFVSGPISVLEIKQGGLHWFSRGSCGVKPPNLRSR